MVNFVSIFYNEIIRMSNIFNETNIRIEWVKTNTFANVESNTIKTDSSSQVSIKHPEQRTSISKEATTTMQSAIYVQTLANFFFFLSF